MDAIVTHIEVNHQHGVGALVARLFGALPEILSIRSQDYYEGRQEFGARHVRIAHADAARDAVFWNVLESLGGAKVQRVICIPYFPDDVRTAIALREIFNAPLCTYLMDDQNLHADGISDALMQELLDKSWLRLAISTELREAYERKFGRKMWLMPPLAPARLIPEQVNLASSGDPVIAGNIWGRRWVELLRETVRGSGVTLGWYNHGEFRWLPCSLDDLARDGILAQASCPDDEEMVAILRRAPFVVVPSGTLDETDDRRFIAELSLPSRIPYIFATSHAPILVLGHPETAAARFVTRAGIGLSAAYERNSFVDAVRRLSDPEVNRGLREAALRLGPRFSDRGAAEWIWESLARGAPADDRYEN